MRKWFSWVDTKKIIKICLLTPSIACESERGPALQEQEFESNKVRVSLLVDDQEFESDEVRVSLLVDDELYSARPWAIIPQTRVQALPACHNDSTAVRALEALALSFVDEDLAPQAIPERIYARKPCASAYERPPARSSTRQAFSSCRRREQELSTEESRPSPKSRRSKVQRAVSARTRRRPRPRKS